MSLYNGSTIVQSFIWLTLAFVSFEIETKRFISRLDPDLPQGHPQPTQPSTTLT